MYLVYSVHLIFSSSLQKNTVNQRLRLHAGATEEREKNEIEQTENAQN